MRIGLSAYDIGAADFAALAEAADQAGFDSMWLGEHVVRPVSYTSEHPSAASRTTQHHQGPVVAEGTLLIDPFVTLAAASVRTTRIMLATGIYLLPLRHPIAVARSIATLQELAKGRFTLGVGAGWLAEEFRALGVEFGDRWSLLNEHLEVIRLLLTGQETQFSGRHVEFDAVRLDTGRIDVPIVLGGNSPAALRRASRYGDGWLSSGTPTLSEAKVLRADLDRACASIGRERELLQWYRARFEDAADLDGYEANDFQRVVLWADRLWPRHGDLPAKREHFEARLRETGLHERLLA